MDQNLLIRAVFLGIAVTTACQSTVLTPDPPVDPVATSLVVSADSIEVAVGDTMRLTALVLDQFGDPMAGSQASWSSSNDSVAEVSTLGRVTARGAGSGTVQATFGVLAASVIVVVLADTTSPPPPPPPPPAAGSECDETPESWLWCDDFDADRLDSYFEIDNAGGSFTRQSSGGLDDSPVMAAHWSPGQVNAGALHLAIGRSPDNYRKSVTDDVDLREVYWRLYFRQQEGWQGDGAYKLSRAFIFHSTDNWGQAMIAHVWSGGPSNEHLVLDPASGTDAAGNVMTSGYNDAGNMRWLGIRQSSTEIFAEEHRGEWHCVEAQVRLNEAGSENGIFRLWIDDELEAETTSLNWVGAYDDYGLNAVFVENYWNGGSPADQTRYIDNFVVSTERIGCNP